MGEDDVQVFSEETSPRYVATMVRGVGEMVEVEWGPKEGNLGEAVRTMVPIEEVDRIGPYPDLAAGEHISWPARLLRAEDGSVRARWMAGGGDYVREWDPDAVQDDDPFEGLDGMARPSDFTEGPVSYDGFGGSEKPMSMRPDDYDRFAAGFGDQEDPVDDDCEKTTTPSTSPGRGSPRKPLRIARRLQDPADHHLSSAAIALAGAALLCALVSILVAAILSR
jgi:hypothetical protein